MTIIKVPIHKVLSKGRELNEKLLSFEDTETEDKDLENLNEISKYNYFPKTRDELQELIYKLIEERGNKADLNDIYTGNITDMTELFLDSNFNGDISDWDVHNVKTMNGMFYKSKFNGNISKWNVSNVKDMNCMFARSSFNGDISKWDVHNVEDMVYMFAFSPFTYKHEIENNWSINIYCNTSFMFYHCGNSSTLQEKLLSFEDTESENNDLENLNKISEIAERKKWFEENCKPIPEGEHEKSYLYSSTDFKEFDKKYMAFTYVSDKPNNFKGFDENNKVNIIDRNTYKIISENEWFSDVEFNSIIADPQNKNHFYPICVVRQRTINEYDMTEECYNFLNIETGNLLSPTLWFDGCGWHWREIRKINGKPTTNITFSADGYEHLNSYIDIREIGEVNFFINEDGEFYTSTVFEGHNKSFERIYVDEIKEVLGFKNLSFDGCHDFINFRKYCLTESKVNEKLLSFEDKDSEDNDLENLTKVNKIADFEANYSIISDEFMNDELNVLGKKQGFFIVYHNKRSKFNAVPNKNIISSKTYELVSPNIWFAYIEGDSYILRKNGASVKDHSFLDYNLLPVSVLVVNEQNGATEDKLNFLNLETGKLLFSDIWFDHILSEGFITARGHFNENDFTIYAKDLCQCTILMPKSSTFMNLNLYVTKDGELYVRERTGNREDPYPTYVNMTAEEIIKKYHLEQYDIAPVSKSNYIKEQDINEKLLTFNDEDEDKEAEELDNLFVLGNLETQKPKMIQWFLNYGLNLNDVTFETYNNDPVISVNGDLDLSGKGITRLPWPFYKINGSFNISNNKLTSCNNLPVYVGGRMNMNNNFIKSFEGLPTRYVGVTLEANHQKCKTAYPLTNENAQIYMKNGSDAELKKNRVKVRVDEDFEYGTICGINESETMAEVLLDEHDKSEMFNVEDVYPLEQDLL